LILLTAVNRFEWILLHAIDLHKVRKNFSDIRFDGSICVRLYLPKESVRLKYQLLILKVEISSFQMLF